MKGHFFKLSKYLLFFICFQSNLSYAVDESLLLAAQNMLSKGQSVEAFDLLNPHEEEYAGDKDYDYLYGLALLDTGESSAAVFAFQRVLAIEPNFAGARLELGRSYFDMGQMQRAQREFLIVQNQSPPKNVSDVIDKYMAAIESRNLKNRRGWRGFLQLGLGNDSNANNATDATVINIDLADPILPSDESRQTSSSVISTLGGARYDLPLTFDSSFFFKGSISQRSNNDASETSTVNYDLLAGYTNAVFTRGEITLSSQVYSADVDGGSNNTGYNLTGQFMFNFSHSNQLGFFLRAGVIDYISLFDYKDVNQNIAGLSWAHIFGSDSRVSMVLALTAGQDTASDETTNSNPDYSRTFNGIRMSLAYPITHRINLFTTLGQTDSDYEDGFGNIALRSDSFTDFSIGSSWKVNKNWVLKAVVGSNENTSNNELYVYQKNLVMFTARSEFLP